jgi:hypothetical protein
VVFVGVKRGNVTSTIASILKSSSADFATSASLHILDLAASFDGQVRCFSISGVRGKYCLFVSALVAAVGVL